MRAGQWSWNETDSENWPNELFNTRAEAIKDAITSGVGGTFWVGQVQLVALPKIDASCTLENAAESTREDAGEIAEDYLDDVSLAHTQELEKRLNEVFEAWAKEYGYMPSFYKIVNIVQVAEATALEEFPKLANRFKMPVEMLKGRCCDYQDGKCLIGTGGSIVCKPWVCCLACSASAAACTNPCNVAVMSDATYQHELQKAHKSDCAVHNEPAEPAGKCDCKEAEANPYFEKVDRKYNPSNNWRFTTYRRKDGSTFQVGIPWSKEFSSQGPTGKTGYNEYTEMQMALRMYAVQKEGLPDGR